MKNKKITLSDVAKQANVSAITVSRVVNHPDKVSAPVREKVKNAIEMLGYIPNRSASALASARSGFIGAIIPSLSNNVFIEVLRGIYEAAGPAGYQVLMADSNYSPIEEEHLIRTLLGQSPEAMVITGDGQTEYAQNMLKSAGIPVVQLMEIVDNPIDMNVGISHRKAAYDMVREMLNRGYDKLGFIGARMDPRAQQRLKGYRVAMEEAGLYRESWVMTTAKPSSIAMGGTLFASLMAESNGELNGVFCLNDDLAMGVLLECQRMQLGVPEKMAIAGFNDIEASALLNPPLSSVNVPRYQMGATAIEMVLKAIRNEPELSKVFDCGYTVKMRESTKQK